MNSALSRMLWGALFYSGIASIPFDNLAFAPSMGWAAVSPYLFGLSVVASAITFPGLLSNALRLTARQSFLFILILVLGSISAYVAFDYDFALIALTAFKLLLGYSFLLSMIIARFVMPGWEVRAIKMLAVSYFVALMIGLIQLFGGGALDGVFNVIFARYYAEKVQFTFTEPSFASLHVFGVALPFILLANRVQSEGAKLKRIGLAILLVSLLSGSSLRALMDLVLVSIACVFVLSSRRRAQFLIASIFVGGVILSYMPSRLADRLDSIANSQEILDPSAAVRKFRLDAALGGVLESPVSWIVGYGFGNSGEAMASGYDRAYSKLSYSYDEIEQLKSQPDGLVYSMHGKILAEHGIVFYLFLLILLFKKEYTFFWLLSLIVYLQFDSYAFYTIWIFIYAKLFGLGKDQVVGAALFDGRNSKRVRKA